MSRDLRMYPMPPSARDEMEFALNDIPVEHRFSLRLAIRKTYAAGYDQGHHDGYREARSDVHALHEQARADEAADRTTPTPA